MSTPNSNFADRLAAAINLRGTPACVGLDPVLDKLPPVILKNPKLTGQADKIEAFCLGVIEAVSEIVGVVKPQSACFERYGAAGQRVLKAVIRSARAKGMMVILDAKRGDIGVSAEHYAAAIFGTPTSHDSEPSFASDAVTLNGYLGMDTIEPFLTHPGRGAFVLVRTSNPGSDALQSARLHDGRSVAEALADQVAHLGAARLGAIGLSDVGAVVGATKSSEAAALRARMPNQVFLVPGYGAQGGTIDDIRTMLRPGAKSAGELGVVVNASRSVLYPAARGAKDWTGDVRAAAQAFADELRVLVPISS